MATDEQYMPPPVKFNRSIAKSLAKGCLSDRQHEERLRGYYISVVASQHKYSKWRRGSEVTRLIAWSKEREKIHDVTPDYQDPKRAKLRDYYACLVGTTLGYRKWLDKCKDDHARQQIAAEDATFKAAGTD